MSKARIIAFYLPQYHPIPENNQWWGEGFTEWTNVVKAKPLFKGHEQPRIPTDLGFYDLRLSETREAQAELARKFGIEGFCYWEYWFGDGRRLLERPFDEVLASGKPDFPFCLGWANHSWGSDSWKAQSSRTKISMFMEQRYSEEDYVKHFYHNLPAFKDHRYITVEGKPLYLIFNPRGLSNAKHFIELWQKMAKENGLKGIHFVGITNNLIKFKEKDGKKKFIGLGMNAGEIYNEILDMGFDAVNSRGIYRAEALIDGKLRSWYNMIVKHVFKVWQLRRYDMAKINKYIYVNEDMWDNVYPTILPNWDRSPRAGKEAGIYVNDTPEVFRQQLNHALSLVKDKPEEHRIIFAQSWNEWAEGNYLEPDSRYGRGYLNVIKELNS